MPNLVFISHSHKEEKLVRNLVEFVLSALELTEAEVRCTSVPGFQLPFGRTISEQLRDDINISTVIIAVLTQESLSSGWVLFELGASWALKTKIVPILAPGLVNADLPGPLSDYPCIRIDAEDARSRLSDAIREMSSVLSVRERTGGRVQAKLDELLQTFNSLNPAPSPVEIPMHLGSPRGELTSLRDILTDVSSDWIVTYMGDIYLRKLQNVFSSLQHHKRIESGYAYWGIGPALRWREACYDALYHMRSNIQRFPATIVNFRGYFKEKEFNYVSLGVGEGSKDMSVISNFFSGHEEDFTYFPVDMSLEMLRFAIEHVQQFMPRYQKRIAIQRDFENLS
jgi:hypothetical protein